MAYQNTIPQSFNPLNISQGDLLANFQAIYDLIGINHVNFGGLGGQGKHNFVTFPVQVSAPAFASGEEVIYNLNYTTTAKNELWIHKQTFSGTAEIPFTASTLSTSASVSVNGWTYLPSGIILAWQQVSGTGNVSVEGSWPGPSATTATIFATIYNSTTPPAISNVAVKVSSTSFVCFYNLTNGSLVAGTANVFAIRY